MGVANDSLSPGQALPGDYPNQPVPSKGSIESSLLTYWWGATICPPEMNDIALAETLTGEKEWPSTRVSTTRKHDGGVQQHL